MKWSEIPVNPSASTLRRFAWLGALLLTVAAGQQYLVRQNEVVALVLLAIAITAAAVGLVRPLVLRRLFVGWMILVFPLHYLVSHLILASFFYCVFTPLGVFFKLIRRDVLKRSNEPEQDSYWTEKPTAKDVGSYFRQS